ncbi:carboxypeptidase-like regulatory domain-containing protein [Bacteroides congonensis]|uniref:carboxypeptidase-like regulatory domain-containing protein n=1 Tax=Bacteroides congonensis TaxID=1871006 RepID=UPI0025AC452D|nr:carboxypeptidase-like regulatory domain-containing protein [Bacteroides congonensis]
MKQRFSQHMRYYERSLILVLMLFSASVMQAQNRTVKGTVSDAQGEPIIGANVVIVGGTKGVITDLDGKYSIQVPENGAVLKFSYIGFKTKSFNVVKGKNVLNVTLEEDAVMLEQTVVTAMDLRRDEKSLSTAFQKMDVESMTENRDAGFVNMLAGKVAGLQVISNGAAGSANASVAPTPFQVTTSHFMLSTVYLLLMMSPAAKLTTVTLPTVSTRTTLKTS